jgi:ABC-type multidrug transport system ATPase subunit
LRAIANATAKNLEVDGEVLFNCRRLRPSDRRQILSFVAQDAPLLGEFTVMETMWFAARLYFGYSDTTYEEIQAKVDDILKNVGLESCKDVVVGNLFFRGLSGGQRKRLSIAVELISSPAVIVMDEPTSGLDSSAAMLVVEALQELSSLGHTILASVHQPSSKMWAEFTKVMLMSQGRCVYFGQASKSVDYFAGIGLQCPDRFNPADYFSAVLSVDFASEEFHLKSPEELADIFASSTVKRLELDSNLERVATGRKTLASTSGNRSTRAKTKISVPELGGKTSKFDALSDDDNGAGKLFGGPASMKQAGFFSSTFTLCHRFMKSLYREPGLVLARLVAYVVLGIVLGLVYLNIGQSTDTESIMARSAVLVSAVGFYSFLSVSAIPFIMDNRQVFDRERKNGAYPIISYVLADVVALVPATALLALVASLFIVFMLQLRNFGIFYLALWLMLFCVECLVHAIACVFGRMETGIAITVGIFGIIFLCAGFFIQVPQMSWAIRWVAYISPIRYSFRTFMRNEFETMGNMTSPQFPTGVSVLEFFALNDDPIKNVWGDMGIVGLFSVIYICSIYLAIRLLR